MWRWAPLIAGGALVTLGLTRKSKAGAAIAATGGLVALAGALAGVRREFVAQCSMTLNCSPEEAYRFWRNVENLPLFMRHLESVTLREDGRSRWTARGLTGAQIIWEAETVSDQPDSFLSWRSLPDSDVNVEGSVEFRRLPGTRGTLVKTLLKCSAPDRALGLTLGKLLGKDPNFLMRQDLRRFKALIETGEIPTIEGQSHGPRSGITATARVLDPSQPLHRAGRIGEVAATKRRLA